jgi:hypothetical protein
MKLYFSEQDVIDSCCVFAAKQEHCRPEELEVDLQFNPERGFGASIRRHHDYIWFQQQDIVDSIAFYLAEYHCFIPDHLQIDLMFSENNGIEADIIVA